MTVVPATGEILGRTASTPDQARDAVEWLREMQRSVLKDGVDYGQFGNARKPTLLKPGAEILLNAAGLAFENKPVDDEWSREHRGVMYRCVVFPLGEPDLIRATCDGYCGRDEHNHKTAGWNTIVKMAQKRAFVGAVLNAVSGSGIFAADLDDGDDTPSSSRVRGTVQRTGTDTRDSGTVDVGRDSATSTTSAVPAQPQNVPGNWLEELADAEHRRDALGHPYITDFWRQMRSKAIPWPPDSVDSLYAVKAMLAELEAHKAEEVDTYGPT